MRMPFTPAFDALEPRALLSAPTVAYVSASNNNTGVFVVVDYTADEGLDFVTIGNGDLIATAPNHPVLTGNVFGDPQIQQDGTVRAIYLFGAPEGAWSYADTGNYVVTSPVGEVRDLMGQNLVAGDIRTLQLWFSQPHATIPDTTVRSNDWLIVVNYRDNVAIDVSSIDATDIAVEGPGLFTGITLQQTIVTSANNVTAVYRVPAPAGGWNYLHTGSYNIVLTPNAVRDNTGLAPATHSIRRFGLGFNNPAAVVLGTTVRSDDWLIPIRFSGLSNIDTSSITNGVVRVTAPNGYSQDGTIYQQIAGSGGSQTVVFRFTAREGFWDFTDNASYTLSMVANTVKDSNNRYVTGSALKSYGLFFNNPSAVAVSAYAVRDRFDLIVRFDDNGTLDTSTISAAALSISGPTPATITLVTTLADPVHGTRAVFRITPNGGTFSNGSYTIRTVANQVRDTQNYALNAGLLRTYGLYF